MQPVQLDVLSEEQLWKLVTEHSLIAFEEFVRRHQSAVASVAYSICGDFAASEDIAQDAFLSAWQTRECLQEPAKSRAWVCGIARNLANGEIRRSRRHLVSLQHMSVADEPTSDMIDVSDSIVRKEEEAVVWKSLEEIPVTYRESLILFYREDQSVASIAKTLDITEEAARQRLSRGRELLRHQVAAMIEGTMLKTRPAAAFTTSVMAAVAVLSGSAKAAMATGTAGVAGSVIAKSTTGLAATGSLVGIAGGLAGTATGLAGGWFGTWLPAQLAPTNRERIYSLGFGKRILTVSLLMTVAFVAIMFGLTHWHAPPAWTISATLIFVFGIQVWVFLEVWRHIRTIRKIRSETSAEADPNSSPWGDRLRSGMSRYEGRVWQSKTILLGRPLIDINVSDPANRSDLPTRSVPKIARGWIAIGDRANGILLGVGGRACGLVAIGGMSIGVISIGGLSAGLISCGGLAVGLVSIGGLGLGGFAIGGLAIGYQAVGGLALAWDFACGGAAASFHWAYGGGAWARDAAIGGAARAPVVNTPELRQMMEAHWTVRAINWQTANMSVSIFFTMAIPILPSILMTPLMYRRKLNND